MKLIENKELLEKNEYFNQILLRAKIDLTENELDSCLTKARTCLEEVCCYIIEKSRYNIQKKGDLPKLANQAREILHLNITPELDSRLRQQYQGIIGIIDSISSLRNIASDAHGVGSNRIHLTLPQTTLCLNCAIALKEYFMNLFINLQNDQCGEHKTEENATEQMNEASEIEDEPMGLFDGLATLENSTTILTGEFNKFNQYNNEFIALTNGYKTEIEAIKDVKSKPTIINHKLESFSNHVNKYNNVLESTLGVLNEQWENCYVSSNVVLSSPFISDSEKEMFVSGMLVAKQKVEAAKSILLTIFPQFDSIKGLNSKLTTQLNNLQNKIKKFIAFCDQIINDVDKINKA